MAINKRRYPKEEFARRGDAIYEKDVRPHLEKDDEGKFLAIDIETAAYEIAEEQMTASMNLRARVPDAQIWMMRVGSKYLTRFGGHEAQGKS